MTKLEAEQVRSEMAAVQARMARLVRQVRK